MAENKMDKFIFDFFKTKRLREEMDENSLATLMDYATAHDYPSKQVEGWAKYLFQWDASTESFPTPLTERDAPNADDTTVLPDDEATKLYELFRSTLANMHAHTKQLEAVGEKNTEALDFLDEHFGSGNVFEAVTASREAEEEILKLSTALTPSPGDADHNNNIEFIKGLLEENGLFDDKFTFESFTKGLSNREYNTSPDFVSKLDQAARILSSAMRSSWGWGGDDAEIRDYKDKLKKLQGFDFTKIRDGFKAQKPDARKLQTFRTYLPHMMNTLRTNGKLRQAFGQYGGDKVTKYYDKVQNDLDFDKVDSANYIPPKKENTLTPWQQMRKFVGDTYDDTLKKYLTLKGDRNYVQEQAKTIVSALDKAGMKKTAGLADVIAKVEDVKKAIRHKKPASAYNHFTWMAKTLDSLKGSDQFKGALQHGQQMRGLIGEIVHKAAEEAQKNPGKAKEIEEYAKTTMEVLSVIQYGHTTSKIMETFSKQEFSLFSDGSLSWNKYEGVQFVARAMDYSIKTALKGVGYGITATVNGITSRNSKFSSKNKKDQKLIQKSRDIETKKLEDRTKAEQRRADMSSQRSTAQSTLDILDRRSGINAATINTKRQDYKNGVKALQNLEAEQAKRAMDKEAAEDQITSAQNGITQYQDRWAQLSTEIPELTVKLDETKAKLEAYDQPLNSYTPIQITEINMLQQALENIEKELSQKNDEYGAIPAKQQELEAQLTAAQDQVRDLTAEMARQDPLITNQRNQNDDLNSKLVQYNSASDTIKNMDAAISKINDKLAKMEAPNDNIVDRLMWHWNYLETGRKTRTGPQHKWWGRASKNQKDYTANVAAHIQHYKNTHTM